MIRRSPLTVVLAVALLAVIAIGGGGFWYLFLREAGPAAVGDPSAAPGASAGVTLPAASCAPSSSDATAGLDGTWTVDPSIGSFSDFSDSFVGYRVKEQLAGIGANTAVGRTPNVTGSLTLAGTSITDVQVSADLTTLQSDDSRRDGQLSPQGIATSSFPTATFKLAAPIQLAAVPADCVAITTTATGDLTLHGVTKSVQVTLQAERSGAVVTVTGSTTIVFADFGFEGPSSFAVLSVEDHGVMEFQLHFRHA
jgi:polyisoprenoid-binding protein YceI